MISTVTTTTTTVTTYTDLSVFIWVLVVLIASITYHYIKTKEYKGIILGSILIGAILGFIYGAIISYLSIPYIVISNLGFSGAEMPYGLIIIVSLILIIAYILAGIILALLGGLTAVFLKRILKK